MAGKIRIVFSFEMVFKLNRYSRYVNQKISAAIYSFDVCIRANNNYILWHLKKKSSMPLLPHELRKWELKILYEAKSIGWILHTFQGK